MTSSGDLLGGLQKKALELVRGAAESVDLEGLRSALEQIERGASGSGSQGDATVTTAIPLTDEERAAFESRLRDKHGDGLPIAFRVDPSILGGVIVRVGDRYIDGSVIARLGQLRQEITGSGAG